VLFGVARFILLELLGISLFVEVAVVLLSRILPTTCLPSVLRSMSSLASVKSTLGFKWVLLYWWSEQLGVTSVADGRGCNGVRSGSDWLDDAWLVLTGVSRMFVDSEL